MGLLRGRARLRPQLEEDLSGVADAALVKRAQLGDRPAFAELYRCHVGTIYDFCAHRLSGREAAEDATQAVFMRAIGSLPECQNSDALRAWLFGIARHVVLDVYRANKRRGEAIALHLAGELVDRSPSPERLALATEEHARVRRARSALKPEERELLDLLQQELNDKEIAEILGRRHGAIRTAHWRLRRKLYRLLGNADPSEEARYVEPWGRAERARLSRYGNALVGGATPDELDRHSAGLSPALLTEIALVRRGHDVRTPDPAFVRRLEDDLMHVMAMPRPVSLPLRSPILPPSNGRVSARTWGGRKPGLPGLPSRARRWAGAQMATAIMLTLVLFGTFFVFHENRPAVLPPAQETPTPVATPATPDAHAWPLWGGNPTRTCAMPGTGPQGEPVVLWTNPPDGTTNPRASVVRGALADGVLYLPAASGAVVALDAATGDELWRADGFGKSVVVDGDGLIVHGNVLGASESPTDLARISRADGSVIWRAEVGQINPNWNPVVADGVGYVPSGGNFVAFDPATGARLWSVPLDAPASRGASVQGGLAVLGDQQGTIYGIATAGGDVVWTYQTDATTIGHPSIANGIAYLNQYEGPTLDFIALDLATGALRWRFAAPSGKPFHTAAVDETTIYLPSDDGTLYAVDAATGELHWQFDTGTAVVQSPALVGGTLYVAAESGFAFALDPATGTERWRLQLAGGSDSAAIVVDGVFYLSTSIGEVFAIGGLESVPAAGVTPAADAASPSADAAVRGSTPVPGGSVAEFVWAIPPDGTGTFRIASAIRLDPFGRLWVADAATDQFLIYDLDGSLVETWGSAGSGDGQIDFDQDPDGIDMAFAPDGTLYVLDSGNHRVQRFGPDRAFVLAWGSEGTGDGQFQDPNGIALAADDTVYVADNARGIVQRSDANGTFLGQFGTPGFDDGQFSNSPAGVAVGPDGAVYVADLGNSRVQVFDAQETYLRQFGRTGDGDGELLRPFGGTLDAAGNVYVGDIDNHRIVVFAPDGTYLAQWGSFGTGPGEFLEPANVVLTRAGTAFVVDWGGNRIQKFKLLPPLGPA